MKVTEIGTIAQDNNSTHQTWNGDTVGLAAQYRNIKETKHASEAMTMTLWNGNWSFDVRSFSFPAGTSPGDASGVWSISQHPTASSGYSLPQ